MGIDAVVQEDAYDGITVYPLTVGVLVKERAAIARLRDLCLAEGVTRESFLSDPMSFLGKLFPMAPDLLRLVTRRTDAEVELMTVEQATGVLAVALRQNIGYMRKIFGPAIIQAAVETVTEPTTSSGPSSVSSPEDIASTT